METFSALPAFWEGNHRDPVDSPHTKGPVVLSVGAFFDVSPKTVEQTVEFPVILDDLIIIWRHRNDILPLPLLSCAQCRVILDHTITRLSHVRRKHWMDYPVSHKTERTTLISQTTVTYGYNHVTVCWIFWHHRMVALSMLVSTLHYCRLTIYGA